MNKKPAGWHVYMIRCSDGTIYTGIAKDLARRVAEHDSGKGCRYTRGRHPVELVWSEARRTRATASRREAEIKSLSRSEKEALCVSGRLKAQG